MRPDHGELPLPEPTDSKDVPPDEGNPGRPEATAEEEE